ncbi:MAG: carboxypeptidase-like regulatory domain-containing protein [Flavisolibacter sp.]
MKKINLSIPKPCHENWNQMTQVEKGRFCNSCQKVVVDFTTMSDRELAAFFKKYSGSLCGRFQQEQLNHDINIPRKRIPWVKYFFQFTLPAFLISLKTYGQKEKPAQHKEVVTNRLSGTVGMVAITPDKKPNLIEITGKVVDENGIGLAYATVTSKGYGAVACDSAGNFSIWAERNKSLVASFVGYQSKELVLHDTSSVVITLDAPQLSGEVVVTGLIAYKPPKPISLIKQIRDTAFNRFSIYPNPAYTNSSFTINTKKMKSGDYTFSIINLNGIIIQTKEVEVEHKEQLLSFSLQGIANGSYTVNFTNKKSGKTYTEKLIVQ